MSRMRTFFPSQAVLTCIHRSLNGSLIVNPWDKFAVADAIHEALTMPIETRTTNFVRAEYDYKTRGFVVRNCSEGVTATSV